MPYLNQSDMPGPSEEAKALQHQQCAAYEAMYDALSDVRRGNPDLEYPQVYQHPVYLVAKQTYEQTVTALQALLGDTAHCNHVDIDLWSTFNDCYKDDTGIRPRGMHYTREAVLKYLAARP